MAFESTVCLMQAISGLQQWPSKNSDF